MVQITADPQFLSTEQRQAVADFILNYPSSSLEDDEIVAIPAFSAADADEPEEPAADDAEAAAIFGAPMPLQPSAIMPPPVEAVSGPQLVPPPPAAGAPTSNLDKTGLPWDERIHAGSRATTADGSWRKKRGIDDATVAQVETELKALMGLPGVPAPPAVTATVPAPPLPAAVIEDRQAYVALLSMASAAILAKTLTTEQLSAAVISVGVPTLPLLANRLDLVPQVHAAIKAIVG